MPREAVLGKIREAEEQRRQLEEEAQKEKDRIIQEARLAAQKTVEEAQTAADAAAAQRIELEAKKVHEERTRILSTSERETARKREASRARLDQAAGYIVNELVRQLNA